MTKTYCDKCRLELEVSMLVIRYAGKPAMVFELCDGCAEKFYKFASQWKTEIEQK